MRRRSRAGGEPAKAQRRNAVARNTRVTPKTVRPRHTSAARDETKVARLTRELSAARQQQRATSEILGVISRSNFKLQPVLHSVVKTAMRLCRAEQAVIYRQQDGTYRFAAGCLKLCWRKPSASATPNLETSIAGTAMSCVWSRRIIRRLPTQRFAGVIRFVPMRAIQPVAC